MTGCPRQSSQHAGTSIRPDRIDIWQISLAQAIPAELYKHLSPTEVRRGQRLKSPEKKRQFLAGRVYLRMILGRSIGLAPHAITFRKNRYGRPYLSPKQAKALFSLSHSGDQLMIAITQEQMIGIDIERMQPDRDYIRLAQRFFSPQEQDQLYTLEETQRHHAFYRGWVRKEAFVKAIGTGIANRLPHCGVSLDTQDMPTRIRLDEKRYGPRPWFNRLLCCPPGYAAALACPRPDTRICYRRLAL